MKKKVINKFDRLVEKLVEGFSKILISTYFRRPRLETMCLILYPIAFQK